MRNFWMMFFAGVMLFAAPSVGAARAQQDTVKNSAPDGTPAQGTRPGGSPRAQNGPVQNGASKNPSLSRIDGDRTDDESDPMSAREKASRVRAFAEDRQKHIVDETAKLLRLATELKAAVDKSNKNEMSLDVVKKAENIEKLAHDVKQRMRS